jgi:hypothetical protein
MACSRVVIVIIAQDRRGERDELEVERAGAAAAAGGSGAHPAGSPRAHHRRQNLLAPGEDHLPLPQL